jgi:hypothetical protein
MAMRRSLGYLLITEKNKTNLWPVFIFNVKNTNTVLEGLKETSLSRPLLNNNLLSAKFITVSTKEVSSVLK